MAQENMPGNAQDTGARNLKGQTDSRKAGDAQNDKQSKSQDNIKSKDDMGSCGCA